MDFKELEDASAKWEDFISQKNSGDVIIKKASALAIAMTYLLSDAIKTMQASFKDRIEIEDEKLWSAYYDLLLYMMHIADREAYEYLNENMRHMFMKELVRETIEICANDFKDNLRVDQFKANFQTNYNLFQNEFAQYERGKTGNLNKDLLYMYTDRVRKRLGLGSDISFKLQFSSDLGVLEFLLNIPLLLSEPFEAATY
jgi:hypothetical protein